MDNGKDSQYLSRHYGDAVAGSGGIPVILPLLEEPALLAGLVGTLDGVVLTGSSSDVDPARYGATKSPECGPVQQLRDRTDFFLLEQAFAHRLPVLAICYGLQSLNVFLGGTLVQDIPTCIQTDIKHSRPRTGGRPAHDVRLSPDSILERLAGNRVAQVNSTHHQAVDRLGKGLEVIAEAADGVVEGVRGTSDSSWILGVQWHPEKSYSLDAFSQKIFHHFLAQCRGE